MKSNAFLCGVCGILMIFILIMPKDSIAAVAGALELWSTSVFPSLFPFFVLTSILKQTGITEQLIYNSTNKLDYNLVFTTIIGFMCGYPSTSKLIGQSDSMENPLPIYAISTAPSPVFIAGTVATIFLQNTFLAVYLLAATYLSLFTSYLIVRLFCRKTGYNHRPPRPAVHNTPIGHLITGAILDGMKSQGIILGIITVISIIAVFLEKINGFQLLAVPFYPLTFLLGIPKSAVPSFIKGLLEMTTGVSAICGENISVYHKLSACGFITSFGGMSIILESLSFINEKIKATSIIGIKLLHGFFTCLYIRLLLFIFPTAQRVAFTMHGFYLSPLALFASACALCLFILAVTLRICRRGT